MALPNVQTVTADTTAGAIAIPTIPVSRKYTVSVWVKNFHATLPVYLTDGSNETTPWEFLAGTSNWVTGVELVNGDSLSLYATAQATGNKVVVKTTKIE